MELPRIISEVDDFTLAAVMWQFALVYLDHIFILSKTRKGQIHHTCEVRTFSNNANVTLKYEKCQILKETIDYFGHLVRPRRLEIELHVTNSIGRLGIE